MDNNNVKYKDKIFITSIGNLSIKTRIGFLFSRQIEIKSTIKTEHEVGLNEAEVLFRPITPISKFKGWWNKKFNKDKGLVNMSPIQGDKDA